MQNQMRSRTILLSITLVVFLNTAASFPQPEEWPQNPIALDGAKGTVVTLEVPTLCLEDHKSTPASGVRLPMSVSFATEDVQRVLSVVRQWKMNPDHRKKELSNHPMYAELLKRAKLYQEVMTCDEATAQLENSEELHHRWQQVQDIAKRLLSDQMLSIAAQRAVWAITDRLSLQKLLQDTLELT